MRLILLALFASAILLLGCAGYASAPANQAPAQQQSQPSANGQQPPAGSNQQPAVSPPATAPPAASPPQTAPPASASAASVEISGFAFHPSELTVAKGATVTWNNADSMAHTITSAAFDSGAIKNGGSFSFTFAKAGTYDYYCAIHPSMKGKITVAE